LFSIVTSTGILLYSKVTAVGMAPIFTAGDPLSMHAYNIGLFPLICQLKEEFPLVEQPSHVDDAGDGGKFTGMG
jgi:hypothetical protein